MTKSYFREEIDALAGYTAGEQPKIPDLIKLNTNENPYPPSPEAKKALETFELNHKNSKSICGDITTIHAEDINLITGGKQIDVIIGGPPCQGFSMANRQRLIDDPRNHLYKSFVVFS